MASKKKDDDLMFGDRLMPGPNPPAPQPVPGPHPHPAPGPVPPPPPPGLPTYPTCGFIEERFNVLRNEHTGIKNAAVEIKKGVDENKALLNDIAGFVTNGFATASSERATAKASIEGNLASARGDILDAVAEVDSKAAQALTDIATLDAKVVQNFADTNTNVSRSEENVKHTVNTRSNAIDGAVAALHNKIGHGEVTIEDAVATVQQTIDADHAAETQQLSDARADILSKVETEAQACRDHLIEQRTGMFQDIQGEHGRTKTAVDGYVNAARNHVEEDIRKALGIESIEQRATRNSIWDKVHEVEEKVNAVTTKLTETKQVADDISTDTTSLRTTIEGQTGVAVTVNKINSDINQETTGVKALAKANGVAIGNVAATVGAISGNVSNMLNTLGDRGQDVTVYTKLNNLATAVSQVKEVVDAISTEEAEEAIAEVKTVVDGLTTAASNIKTDTAKVNDAIGTRGPTDKTVFERLDALAQTATNTGSAAAQVAAAIGTLAEGQPTALQGIANNGQAIGSLTETIGDVETAVFGVDQKVSTIAATVTNISTNGAKATELAQVAESVNIIRGSVAGEGSNPIAEIKAAVTNVDYGNQAIANLLNNEDYGLRAIKLAVSLLTAIDGKIDALTTRLDAVETEMNERFDSVDAALDALNEQVASLLAPTDDTEDETPEEPNEGQDDEPVES